MDVSTHFVIFGDQSWPVESLIKSLPEKAPVSVFVEGEGWSGHSPLIAQKQKSTKQKSNVRAQTALKAADDLTAYSQCMGAKDQIIAIVGIDHLAKRSKLLDKLKDSKLSLKVLELGSRHKTKSLLASGKRKVFWGDLLSQPLEREMIFLKLQDRIRSLKEAMKGAENIALLLQDDPDPDGLASALALRKLLGRNSQTASICSFGEVTRPENVAMVKLLEIDVKKVDLLTLTKCYDKVVLVDCQPSFFKGRPIPAHAVIDHHPASMSEEELELLDFVDIRDDLGSISTLLTMYLQTADIEMSQRLATALFYGVKSDTLMLNRPVSGLDLEAFVFLYPLINMPILRRIERPDLPIDYLRQLQRSLDFVRENDDLTILPMGDVRNEEWVSQAADFGLQVEGTKLAVGCGIYESKVVISARMCGVQNHLGDLFKETFDNLGAAGGHRSMAKAIIPVQKWEDSFGKSARDLTEILKTLRALLKSQI